MTISNSVPTDILMVSDTTGCGATAGAVRGTDGVARVSASRWRERIVRYFSG